MQLQGKEVISQDDQCSARVSGGLGDDRHVIAILKTSSADAESLEITVVETPRSGRVEEAQRELCQNVSSMVEMEAVVNPHERAPRQRLSLHILLL